LAQWLRKPLYHFARHFSRDPTVIRSASNSGKLAISAKAIERHFASEQGGQENAREPLAKGDDPNRSGLVSRPSEIELTALLVVGPPVQRACSSHLERGQTVTLGERALDLSFGPRLRCERSEQNGKTGKEGRGDHCGDRFGGDEFDHYETPEPLDVLGDNAGFARKFLYLLK
jgi:hypothetical protein